MFTDKSQIKNTHKPGDPYGFPRKMRVVEGMDMDTSVSSSISECMLEYHEKENAIFNPIKVVPEIEGPIIKQSGGYLKETTPDTESARSGDGSTAPVKLQTFLM
ncbi:hypothetical protein NECAME_07137 [Necator americanus]|uniref:Uncharacterized protein n=1 Tax=Necator americanus TaxID=51031 RepID=W2TP38_NECAM|nr:hypothetical protein NECAME_07137 [Necator americanus]ETN83845.1 hypothetical protein NECAME_07137 [Necator americanus]